jgi:hypothetical protein
VFVWCCGTTVPSAQDRYISSLASPATHSKQSIPIDALLLIPGTGVVYTVSSSVVGGRRSRLFAALGCTLGLILHMLAAMLGLSGIMQAGSAVFEVASGPDEVVASGKA